LPGLRKSLDREFAQRRAALGNRAIRFDEQLSLACIELKGGATGKEHAGSLPGHHGVVGAHLKFAGAGVGGGAVRHLDFEKAVALEGDIELSSRGLGLARKKIDGGRRDRKHCRLALPAAGARLWVGQKLAAVLSAERDGAL